MAISSELYPITLKTSTAASGAVMVKLPFISDTVPVEVPFITTLTPINGVPEESVICPVMTRGAKDEPVIIKMIPIMITNFLMALIFVRQIVSKKVQVE
jgi:hypothetical protein